MQTQLTKRKIKFLYLRNVVLVLLGAAAFVLKPAYHGPLAQVFHEYGGNFVVSFAVYFLAANAAFLFGLGRLAAAACALLIVEPFEVTNGFGVMSNVYDPVDLLANAAGVTVALAVDLATRRLAAMRAAGWTVRLVTDWSRRKSVFSRRVRSAPR